MSAHNLTKYVLSGVIDDISTAGQVYLPIPKEFAGEVYELVATLNNAITVADATLTVKVGATTVGTLVVPFTASAAGTTVTASFSGDNAPAGGAIEVETNGGSTTAAKCYVSVVVKR